MNTDGTLPRQIRGVKKRSARPFGLAPLFARPRGSGDEGFGRCGDMGASPLDSEYSILDLRFTIDGGRWSVGQGIDWPRLALRVHN
jgi:hypothetical protein